MSAKNTTPAIGGSNAENLDEAKIRVRRDFKKITRAITSDDFEKLARTTPGLRVARIKVLPQYHPQFPAFPMPGVVTVVVVPEILAGASSLRPEPSKGFLQTVRNHLKTKSLAATNLHVIEPEFVEVKVAAKIRTDARMSAETVRGKVDEAIRKFLEPLNGGTDGKGWPFGRPVFKSEIYQVIERVPGVACVDSVALFGKSCDRMAQDKITLRKIGLVYSGEHEIVVS